MSVSGEVSLTLSRGTDKTRVPLVTNERVMVRVTSVDGARADLEIKGFHVSAQSNGSLHPGDRFLVRVDAVSPTVVLKRIEAVETGATDLRRSLSPGMTAVRSAVERIAQVAANPLWRTPPAEGSSLTALGALLGWDREGAPDAAVLERLFRLFGLDAGGAIDQARERITGNPVLKAAEKILKAPSGDPDATPATVREGVADLVRSAELVRTASRVLGAAGEPLHLEWPLLGPGQAPVRLLLRRESAEAGDDRRDKGPSWRVDLDMETTGLGPLRAALVLGGGIELTLSATAETASYLEAYRTDFETALSAIRTPAVVRIVERASDDEPLPDLAALLVRAKTGLGRMHVTA